MNDIYLKRQNFDNNSFKKGTKFSCQQSLFDWSEMPSALQFWKKLLNLKKKKISESKKKIIQFTCQLTVNVKIKESFHLAE